MRCRSWPGPYGGTVACRPGPIRLLPDGKLWYCAFAEGESLPAELPDGQSVTCRRELEVQVSENGDTGEVTAVMFGACADFTGAVRIVSGDETYTCIAAA